MHIVRASIDTKLSIHLTFFSVSVRQVVLACHMNTMIQFLISFLFYTKSNIYQKKKDIKEHCYFYFTNNIFIFMIIDSYDMSHCSFILIIISLK